MRLLIQILPCAFFCYYPFSDSYRYPRKWVMTVTGAVFTYFYVALDITSGIYQSFLLNIIFLLTLGFLLLVYLFCLRAEMVHKLFVFTIVFIYGFLMTGTVSYAGTRFHAGDHFYLEVWY